MDKDIKTTSRLYYLDNLKGFTILLVVLGHCIQYGMPSTYQESILYQLQKGVQSVESDWKESLSIAAPIFHLGGGKNNS